MGASWSSDVGTADWIVERLHPFGVDVGSVIPDCFAAYARIFHPVDAGGGRRRWSELAARNGRVVHPEMQLHLVSTPVGAPLPAGYGQVSGASWGSLPATELQALLAVLARHTRLDAECWFCVWEGYGQLHGSPAVQRLSASGAPDDAVPGVAPPAVVAGPRVRLPHRNYYLLRGQLKDVVALHEFLGGDFPGQSPNLWWPVDHSWCIATEIDFAWTYIGGTDALTADVIAEADLEALTATTTDQFGYDSDRPNRELG